jgi:hypothetical protein
MDFGIVSVNEKPVDSVYELVNRGCLRSTVDWGGHGGISSSEHKLVGNSIHGSSPQGF